MENALELKKEIDQKKLELGDFFYQAIIADKEPDAASARQMTAAIKDLEARLQLPDASAADVEQAAPEDIEPDTLSEVSSRVETCLSVEPDLPAESGVTDEQEDRQATEQPLPADETPATTSPPETVKKLFCKNCGSRIKPYSRFCMNCGQQL